MPRGKLKKKQTPALRSEEVSITVVTDRGPFYEGRRLAKGDTLSVPKAFFELLKARGWAE